MRILIPVLVLVPVLAWADAASLFIHPTTVMFASDVRSATVNIINRGDATGVFAISWVDYTMTPEGGLNAWEGRAPWSIQPYVRYSPRRVTLKPGQTQRVKIALRRERDVAEGEYYSHLRIVSLNDNVDGPANADLAVAGSGRQAITIKAHTALAIPIIWRNSTATPRAAIESVEIDREMNRLVVDVRRIGDLSTRGYLHVVRDGVGGTRNALADPVPLVIYPTLDGKTVSVPLKAGIGNTGVEVGTQIIYSPDIDSTHREALFASYRIKHSKGRQGRGGG